MWKKFPLIILLLIAIPHNSLRTPLKATEGKITLSILLYPYVPDYGHIRDTMESEFAKRYPNIELQFSEQNWKYYKEGGLDKKYDVYELDTVFLADFSHRLQVLDPARLTKVEYIQPGQDASKWQGGLYGVPHWLCSLFVFYFAHDTEIADAQTLEDLQSAIGIERRPGRGLLIDMKGGFTLGELYIDQQLDLQIPSKQILLSLKGGIPAPSSIDRLGKVLSMVDLGQGRSEDMHDAWPPYYTREFAHGRGRALIGYSERMYHILTEIQDPQEPTGIIDHRRIRVKPFNQGKQQSKRPMLWVDSFVLDKSLSGEKLDAAYKFLNFVISNEIYKKTIFKPGAPPQYLLPARISFYEDRAVLEKAPLYSQFSSSLANGVSLTGPGFPGNLRKMGNAIDKKLDKNLN